MAEPYSLDRSRSLGASQNRLGKDFSFILFDSKIFTKSFSIVIAWIQKFLFQQSAAIAVCGPEQTKVLRQQGYRGKNNRFSSLVRQLPLQTNLQHRAHGTAIRYSSKNFNVQKIQVGFVGALVEQKGVRNLMSALSNHIEYFGEKATFSSWVKAS